MPAKKTPVELGAEKNQFINDRLDLFTQLIQDSAIILSKEVYKNFLDQLDIVGGTITSAEANLKKVELIDRAFQVFQETQGIKVVAAFASDLTDIIALGKEYYVETIGKEASSDQITNIITRHLGIGSDGTPKAGGYLAKLTSDPSMQADLKQLAFQQITSNQAGYEGLKKTIGTYIEGTGENPGAYYSHYKKFAFDTYSEVDRLNSSLHAKKLKLKYFAYNGGTVKDTREFCLLRHGRVYTIDEAQEWKKLVNKIEMRPGKIKDLIKVPVGPIIEKGFEDQYDPVTQLGGIYCRHSPDFISPEVAEYLRSKQGPEPPGPTNPITPPAPPKPPPLPPPPKPKPPAPPKPKPPAPAKKQPPAPVKKPDKEFVPDDLIKKIEANGSYARELQQAAESIEAFRRNGNKNVGTQWSLKDMDLNNLTVNETKVILGYTQNAYVRINRQLYGAPRDIDDATKAYQFALDSALDKVEKFEGKLWRRFPTQEKDLWLQDYRDRVGTEITFDGFASFTSRETYSSSVRFIVNKSTNGRKLHDITHYHGENEVLYQSESVWLVEKVVGNDVYLIEVLE